MQWVMLKQSTKTLVIKYEYLNNVLVCCVMLVGVIVGGILNVTVNGTLTGRVRLPCRVLMAACASALLWYFTNAQPATHNTLLDKAGAMWQTH